MAEAKVQGKPLVVSFVPPAYRLNHDRFLLVARQVPLNPVTPDSPYRKQLEDELLRPETAITAALKLEALGPDSRQPLRVGLESESPWVRFAAAESLAYLGHADGAGDLARAGREAPVAAGALPDGPGLARRRDLPGPARRADEAAGPGTAVRGVRRPAVGGRERTRRSAACR